MATAAITRNNEDKIFSLLFTQDDVTWQTIIYELIKTEEMDPWDVDVSKIAEKFIRLLAEMKKMDFRISGKVIFAAAFFLKIKSDKLLKEDMVLLDSLISPSEETEDLLALLDNGELRQRRKSDQKLTLRSPQPRTRKVSVFDLIHALEKAMQVEQRRKFYRLPGKVTLKIPEKRQPMDIIINNLYEKISKTLKTIESVTFTQLTPSERKEDKIITFIPLLYLDTQRKIDMNQKEHFGEIMINLTKPIAK